jgi:hypothetical protein
MLVGNKKSGFNITPLPSHAQLSMANALVSEDFDKDGNKDLIVAGNYFPMRVQQGPLDASIGTTLKGDGKGNFTAMGYEQTALCIRGDVRNVLLIKSKQSVLLVAAKNNGALQVIGLK